jgi:hypothetical protein
VGVGVISSNCRRRYSTTPHQLTTAGIAHSQKLQIGSDCAKSLRRGVGAFEGAVQHPRRRLQPPTETLAALPCLARAAEESLVC